MNLLSTFAHVETKLAMMEQLLHKKKRNPFEIPTPENMLQCSSTLDVQSLKFKAE